MSSTAGIKVILLAASQFDHVAVRESAFGRFCCKSPKMQAITFPTKRRHKSQTPIDIASRPSPKSPVSSSRDDVTPHMFISTSRLQPGNFMINDEKRLLQQYRPVSATPVA